MSEAGIPVDDKFVRKTIRELYGSSSTGTQHFLDQKSDSDIPIRNRAYSNTVNCKDISVSTVSRLQSSTLHVHYYNNVFMFLQL